MFYMEYTLSKIIISGFLNFSYDACDLDRHFSWSARHAVVEYWYYAIVLYNSTRVLYYSFA